MEDKEAQIAFDREFWREAGSSVIWDAAAEMTLEYYEAKGINPDEAVFQRTVTHIQRARG
ncbi:MAG: hypothetical protein ABFD69_02625 [Candidatus Sumerlaeia bacterium]